MLLPGIQALQDVNNKTTVSLFEVHDNFKVKIHCAQYVTVKELGNVSICLYQEFISYTKSLTSTVQSLGFPARSHTFVEIDH